MSFCWSCIHIILIRTVFWGTIICKLKGGIPTYPTHLGNVQNWHLLSTYYVSDTTGMSFLCEFSPALHTAVSNRIVLFFLYLQVGVVNTVWVAFILNVYYTLILRQFLLFIWNPNLIGHPVLNLVTLKQVRHPLLIFVNTEDIFISSDSPFL